jgi:hypothetical protein
VTDEGYASNETFEQAVETFKNLREVGLEELDSEERINSEKETRWLQISRRRVASASPFPRM